LNKAEKLFIKNQSMMNKRRNFSTIERY